MDGEIKGGRIITESMEERRPQLAVSLTTRVLSDEEMEEAVEWGENLFIEEYTPFDRNEKRRQFNEAIQQQFKLRKIVNAQHKSSSNTERKMKWEVHTKGEAESTSFEICVIRSDNQHGKESFGWFDEDKLLITHNGGPCRWALTQRVWDGAVKLAKEIAHDLNQ